MRLLQIGQSEVRNQLLYLGQLVSLGGKILSEILNDLSELTKVKIGGAFKQPRSQLEKGEINIDIKLYYDRFLIVKSK